MAAEMFGPYRLDRLLGRGGMGEVHLAFDTVKRRFVALKRLPAVLAADEDFQARFRRESEVAARLREPHVIPIHDFGEIDGQLFLDMRLVEGTDLGHRLERDGALQPATAVALLSQVAGALDAAHRGGLVHRDVKPSNILITDDEFVYLIDFGVARDLTSTTITAAGSTVGTPAYMAPERFTGGGDRRVDVYALACVLYETLTGRPPFPPGDLPRLMFAHLSTPPPRVRDARPDVAPALDDVIARGMSKDPADRFQTAGELMTAARDAVMGRSAAGPAGAPVRIRDARETVDAPVPGVPSAGLGWPAARGLTTAPTGPAPDTVHPGPAPPRPGPTPEEPGPERVGTPSKRRMRRWWVLPPAVGAVAVVIAAVLSLLPPDDPAGPVSPTTPADSSSGPPPTFPAGTTMAALATAGTVRVGTKVDQPLFGLMGPEGKPVGFDVEIAKIIARRLGIPGEKITYIETPSSIREDAITDGHVDLVVATYAINDARRERISFAGPYYEAGQDIMVAADNTTITGPEALGPAGARVCSVTGSTPARNLEQYVHPSSIVLFGTYSQCADALRNGQVDAVSTDNVILLGLIEAGQGAFKLVGKPFTREPYGIGITKGDVAFCEFINQTLRDAVLDGSYQAAWDATVGKVQPGVPALPPADTCR